MADVTLTTTFQKLVDAGDEFLLSFKPTARANVVEIVMTANATTDGKAIHHLVPSRNEAATRASLGTGNVYARVQSENAKIVACVSP